MTAETAFGLNSGCGGVVYAHRPQRVDRTAARSGNRTGSAASRERRRHPAFAGRRPDTGCTPGRGPMNARTVTRAERAATAVRLRSEGLTAREIARRMGVSRSYASSLYSDPDDYKARSRKTSYGGECEVCGARTDGSNGRAAAPRYCRAHIGANEDWVAKCTKWPRELLIARIREWAALYGEPPACPDWGPTMARYCNDEARAVRFEHADGHWPWFVVVVNHFGSWNAGIAAAGFEPRAVGGTPENNRRSRRAQRMGSRDG